MAAPIITAITVVPDPIPVGQGATVTVEAFDPDASTVHLSVVVTDSQGNPQTGQTVMTVSDPLTYQVTADQGTVTQDATNPAVWYWVP